MKNHHPFHRPPFRKDSRLFKPFAFFFGGIIVLFIIAILMVIFLAPPHDKGDFRGGFLIPLCGVPLFFIVTSFIIGGLAFRRFGKPMSEIFDAIDSVSEGDLTVRVPERHTRQFSLLAKRFNHMVSELERAEQQSIGGAGTIDNAAVVPMDPLPERVLSVRMAWVQRVYGGILRPVVGLDIGRQQALERGRGDDRYAPGMVERDADLGG